MKKGMEMSTIGYMLVGIFLFLVLTFIYFGHTGFFKKIYDITDKLGITSISKSIKELEEKIDEDKYELTPEEKAAEAKIKPAFKAMVDDMENCLKGSACVCNVAMQQIPEGYTIRFVNSQNNEIDAGVFKFRERTGFDYDEDYQGMLAVHFVSGATHKFENTQACLVVDLSKAWAGNNVEKVYVRKPAAGMVQLYWEDKIATVQSGSVLWATEAVSPGAIYNSERDYRIYGNDKGIKKMYKTKDGRLCFFTERWWWDDSKLVDKIDCKSQKENNV